MKKTISLIVALAMVFVMSFAVFAEGEKPTDPAELGAYYAEMINSGEVETSVIAAEIIADFEAGLITVDTLPTFLTALVENTTDQEALADLLQQLETGLGNLGVTIPDVSVPDVSVPDGSLPDVTLPDDGGDNGDSDFLNSILGILGSIGDIIFGGGDDTGDGDNDGSGDDPWGEGDGDGDGSGDGDAVPDTGDTAIISVAAVALVAGAALVLTRKKSEDAE